MYIHQRDKRRSKLTETTSWEECVYELYCSSPPGGHEDVSAIFMGSAHVVLLCNMVKCFMASVEVRKILLLSQQLLKQLSELKLSLIPPDVEIRSPA